LSRSYPQNGINQIESEELLMAMVKEIILI